MFNTNKAKDIFYIFLWIAVTILLYILVHTFIWEPSTDTASSTYTKHTSTTVKEKTEHSVQQKNTPIENTKKLLKHQEVPVHNTTEVAKTVVVDEVVKSVKTVEIPKIKHEPTPHTDVIKTVKKVVPQVSKKETIIQEKVENKIPVVNIPSRDIAVPSVPQAVNMPEKSISIPTTPSVPSVPSVDIVEKSVPTMQHSAVKEVTTQMQEQTTQKDSLPKELNRDEKMELVEKARQLVIEKAEAARDEMMKSLER